MKGIENLGATCWLNAILQCLKVCRNWERYSGGDTFKTEFYKLINGDTDDTTDFLKLLPFENTPSDSQEALLYILDKLDIKEFEGEETQTVIYPDGKSSTKTKTMFWIHQKKPDVVQGYTDGNEKTHNVAVIERKLTRVPDILVSDLVQEELFGKQLIGVVCWMFGHYYAYVKEAGDWWFVNDEHIRKQDVVVSRGGYIGFYGVGKTFTPRTHFEET